MSLSWPDENAEEVRRRLDESRRLGSRDALWPDLPYTERVDALARIKRVVRTRLEGGSSTPFLSASGEHEARAVSVAAFTAGLGPLLGWWVERGEIDVSPTLRRYLARHLEHGRMRSAMLRSRVAAAIEAMEAVGLSPILLKGLHTGAAYFPDPCTRPASDIDLLVHPSGRFAAERALGQLGFVESRSSTFGARSEWSLDRLPQTVHSIELDHAENPWNLDLHYGLERWYYRGLRRDLGEGVFDSQRRTVVNGKSVRTLDQPYLATFLALHASYDLARMQMVRILELILVVREDRAAGRLEWQDMEALLDRTDTTRFVYPALRLAEELAPGTIDSSLLTRSENLAGPRLRRLVDLVRRAEIGLLSETPLGIRLAWAAGPRDSVMLLAEMLVPGDDGAGSLSHQFAKRLRIVGQRLGRRLSRAFRT